MGLRPKYKNTNAEIIVFDNSSTDGTVEFLRLKDYRIFCKKLEKKYEFTHEKQIE